MERAVIMSAIQRVPRQALSQHYLPGNQETPSVKMLIGNPIRQNNKTLELISY